jgi:hypothetical protein
MGDSPEMARSFYPALVVEQMHENVEFRCLQRPSDPKFAIGSDDETSAPSYNIGICEEG